MNILEAYEFARLHNITLKAADFITMILLTHAVASEILTLSALVRSTPGQ